MFTKLIQTGMQTANDPSSKTNTEGPWHPEIS